MGRTPTVTKSPIQPLPIGDIRRLVQVRLGVGLLPEGLAGQVTEKAEGNPLFAEELVSYLTERGIIRVNGGALTFDATAVSVALPASVQSLLTGRVDRLALDDRALLQAASAIGRRFDPQLLAVVTSEIQIEERLSAMHALDLVRREGKSGDYVFKHALVRDAIYQSLLSEARAALHLKIAQEIESRGGNRLTEVAEILAYHYSQTDNADKAFRFHSMAGSKSLSVYSLDEAKVHLTAARNLLDKAPDCASDDEVADFVFSYAFLFELYGGANNILDMMERYMGRVDRLGLIQEPCRFGCTTHGRY